MNRYGTAIGQTLPGVLPGEVFIPTSPVLYAPPAEEVETASREAPEIILRRVCEALANNLKLLPLYAAAYNRARGDAYMDGVPIAIGQQAVQVPQLSPNVICRNATIKLEIVGYFRGGDPLPAWIYIGPVGSPSIFERLGDPLVGPRGALGRRRQGAPAPASTGPLTSAQLRARAEAAEARGVNPTIVRALRLQADQLDAQPRIGQTADVQTMNLGDTPGLAGPNLSLRARAARLRALYPNSPVMQNAAARLEAQASQVETGVVPGSFFSESANGFPQIYPDGSLTPGYVGPRGALGRRRQGAAAPSQPLRNPTAELLRRRAAEARSRGANPLVVSALIRQAEQLEGQQQAAIQSAVR